MVQHADIDHTGITGVGGAANVPGWVEALVGETATNEYYWDGNDLAGFTELDVTGTTAWTESNNLVSVLVAGMTSGDMNVVLVAKTFSIGDTWVVPVLGYMGHTASGSPMAGIIFTDGVVAGSNAVAGHIQWGLVSGTTGDPNTLLVGRHGTLTAMTTAPWALDGNITTGPKFFPHIKLMYQAANTFRLSFSPDGVTYHAFGEADISKTMTPTHVGLCVTGLEADGHIFTFGPLIKVA